MDYEIVKRFYSDVQANIYYLRLKNAGIACFLSYKNISTILPLGDGGVALNVAENQLEDAYVIIKELDREMLSDVGEEDFREATREDIMYAQKVKKYNDWLNDQSLNMDKVIVVLFLLFVLVILFIVINYFIPFK